MKALNLRPTIFALIFSIMAFNVFADVTKKVGPTASGGDYTTLKAAFDAINAGTIKTGVITLQIVGNTTETASAVLNASGTGSASYTSVKIYPTTSGYTISGSLAAALISLNGAANVTIDGSTGGTGNTKNLTILNSSALSTTGTCTIGLSGIANHNTIKNCTIKGCVTGSSNGVIFINNALTTANNSYNTISNNDITKGSTAPSNCIVMSGNATKPNSNNSIEKNNIYDFSSSGVLINGYCSNNTYSSNNIYQSGTATTSINGFTLSSTITGDQFLDNKINSMLTSGTTTVRGFYLTSYANITIANNVINLSSTNNSATVSGIYDNFGSANSSNVMNIFFNTINITGTGGTSYCFYKSNIPTLNLKNNILVNQRTGTSYVLYYVTANNTALYSNYNDFKKTQSGNFGYYGAAKGTFTDFKDAIGTDGKSHNELPNFISSTDLHINPAIISYISGGGTPVSIIVDCDGNTRNASFPDMGAYEYLADYYEFLGATSSDWETSSNWSSLGIPGAADETVIPDDKAVQVTAAPSSPSQCNNLTILNNSSLTIMAGKALTINGTLNNDAGANITLQADSLHNSSLISYTSGIQTTVERSMQHGRWELISPPVSGVDLSNFASDGNNDVAFSSDDVYRGFRDYNESLNQWNGYITNDAVATYGNLNVGQGYALIRTGSTTTTTSPSYLTFKGLSETGTVSQSVTRTGNLGWNCIGNPYTASIALNENAKTTNNFLTINADSLDASYVAIYAWSDTSTVAFRIINNSDPASYLPVATAFFVKAKVSPNFVFFTPEMRTHQSDVNFRGALNNWYGFDLAVTTKSGNLSTAIKMNSKMTDGLDVSYDGGLMRMSNTYALYSRLVKDNGVDFAVQCVTDTFSVEKILPLGFDYSTGGIATFSAANASLPDGVAISLEDRVAGITTDLTTSGAKYQVNLPINTIGTGRFYIHLIQTNSTGISNLKDNSTIFVEANHNGINIFGNTGLNSTATIYDVNGKAKGTFNLDNSTSNYLPVNDLSSGIYILKIENQSTRLIKKFKL